MHAIFNFAQTKKAAQRRPLSRSEIPGLRRDSRSGLRLIGSSSGRCRFVQNAVMNRKERQLQPV
jgi:hypothetical protein